MNTDFSRNLILLRKERALSQKKVSEDLGISQALLSHYEKGIRECGLDFVVNAADYFNVSCDFLLGRTKQREMQKPEKQAKSKGDGSTSAADDITAAVYIVFGILKKINSKCIAEEVANYLYSSVYTMFRMLYSANDKNAQEPFAITPELYTAVTASKMSMSKAKCRGMLSGATFENSEKINKEALPRMSFDSLESEFPKYYAGLSDLIRRTEGNP